jgi:hypothetical protein
VIQAERVVILLLPALARVLTLLPFVALAVAGLAVARFSLGSGAGDFSLPGLARLIGLPELREEVTDDLALDVSVGRARDLAETLPAVRARAPERLAEHGLPTVPVNVTLTGFNRKGRREPR